MAERLRKVWRAIVDWTITVLLIAAVVAILGLLFWLDKVRFTL